MSHVGITVQLPDGLPESRAKDLFLMKRFRILFDSLGDSIGK